MKLKPFFIFSFLLIFVAESCDNNSGIKQEPTITPLENSWDKAVPHQEIPEGLTSLSAESCGACHQEHYQEWQYSTHSHAWTDAQFQAELKKETSPFMCINCHIPLQNQQEYIVKGLIDGDIYQPVKVKNPHFDKALQQEGINCAACHVRNNVIVGPTGTDKAPHKTVKDTAHLSESLCISCHNAVAVVTPTLACSFETGDEWKAGPYYGQKNCISCHMDTITRSVVPGYDKRLSHHHFFKGSGIPKAKGAKTKIFNGLAFYPSNLPKKIQLNDTLKYNFTVKNEFAGHKVPSGDPERFILIHFKILDQNSSVVYEQTERIGEEWEWHPEAKKIADNNLLPQEERTYSTHFSPKQIGSYKLIVWVEKHRMGEEAATYNKLGEDYPRFITIYNDTLTFQVK
ncbi:MAG: multiheme c-type cytochrome [Putridiphycobacter sp.]